MNQDDPKLPAGNDKPAVPAIWRDWFVWALLAIGLLVQAYVALKVTQRTDGRIGGAVDDVYIHLTFARNVLRGEPGAYNPGEPVPGMTSPGWVLLLAAVSFSEENLIAACVALSALLYALCGPALYRFCLFLGFSRGRAFFAALVLLGTGRFIWAGGSGMEQSAFAFSMLLCLRSHLSDRARGAPGLLTAFLAGIAALFRPEGYLLYPILFGDHLLAYDPPTRKFHIDFKQCFKLRSAGAVAVFAILIAPYIIFCYSTNGRPFPNTYYAKLHEQFTTYPMAYLAMAYHGLFWQSKHGLAALVAIGIARQMILSYRGLGGENLANFRRARVLWLWPALLLGHSALFNPNLLPHFQRYLIPFIPYVVIFLAEGVFLVLRVVKGFSFGPLRRYFRLLVRAGAVLICLAFIPFQLKPWAGITAGCVDNIYRQQATVGEWIRDNTPPDAVIALHDAGAIAFFGDRKIIDMLGLMTSDIMEILYSRRDEPALNSIDVTLYVSSLKPDYIAVYPFWYSVFGLCPDAFKKVFDADLGEDNVICGCPYMLVWKADWSVFKDKPFDPAELLYGSGFRYGYGSYTYGYGYGYGGQPPAQGEASTRPVE